jgi:hypothetical protein
MVIDEGLTTQRRTLNVTVHLSELEPHDRVAVRWRSIQGPAEARYGLESDRHDLLLLSVQAIVAQEVLVDSLPFARGQATRGEPCR